MLVGYEGLEWNKYIPMSSPVVKVIQNRIWIPIKTPEIIRIFENAISPTRSSHYLISFTKPFITFIIFLFLIAYVGRWVDFRALISVMKIIGIIDSSE